MSTCIEREHSGMTTPTTPSIPSTPTPDSKANMANMPNAADMTFEQFKAIYPDLPHDVALYYSDTQKKFRISHQAALAHTVAFALSIGKAVGQPGLPAHESKKTRLLLRSEI